ncbi:MAG: efflux RND transporter periplasmic adaptor subunit [Gemmatimonadota bacterium]|jgi:RND family efflux transporter MFP subunit
MKIPETPRSVRHAAAVLAIGATPLILSACRGGAAQEPVVEQAAPVRVEEVVREDLARPITATGTFGPRDEVELSFKIGGVVDRVAVDEGDRVTSADVLASLDLAEIDAALTRARSAADKAERDLARVRRLYADSVATLSQLQDSETAAEVAGADLRAAEFNRRYAVITAPSGGVILGRTVEPGETVSPGTTALILGSRARGAVVRVGLADRDVVRVKPGAEATATFAALPGRTFRGRVTEIAATASPGVGTYAVEVSLDGADALPAGLVGSVEIRPEEGIRAAVVPVEAVLEADGDRAVVYTLSADGRRAERRAVTVALLDGGRVAVTDGLDDVTTVLTEGAAWLRDGSDVRVVR